MEPEASEVIDTGTCVVVIGAFEVVVLVGAASIHDCRAIATAKIPKHRLFISADLKCFYSLILSLCNDVNV